MTQTYSPLYQQQLDNRPTSCVLKWRQDQLLVTIEKHNNLPYPHLPALENQQSLVDCLKHSPVRLVRLDPELGEAQLNFWAQACEKANKQVFLRLPSVHELPKKRNPLSWWLKRVFDWSAAALLLLVLSPLILGLIFSVRIDSPGPIFSWQWRIGERGRLFRIIKFRTTVAGAEKLHHQVMVNQKELQKRNQEFRTTPIGSWMQKYKLDLLPQLFNVLRGEMSLVGPRPWALHDVVRIDRQGQGRLNALPGITGDPQLRARFNYKDLEAVNHCDLEYLRSWSLWRDLKILPLTMLKVISGFGAY